MAADIIIKTWVSEYCLALRLINPRFVNARGPKNDTTDEPWNHGAPVQSRYRPALQQLRRKRPANPS